jgi:hypothetical protein
MGWLLAVTVNGLIDFAANLLTLTIDTFSLRKAGRVKPSKTLLKLLETAQANSPSGL